ncbi:MAG: hypothetical protein WD231_05180 [Candidatus Woykebacteria bacterium]
MELEMTKCRRCKEETPKSGKFCMNCARVLKPRSYRNWPKKRLRVADDADFGPFMNDIFSGEYRKLPNADAVRWALSRLTPKTQQVLIRLYGLDNGGSRIDKQVAEEVKVTRATIHQYRSFGLRDLRHPVIAKVLLGYHPIPKE